MPRFHFFALLVAAAFGGLVFSLLNLPLPWLLGPISASTLARLTFLRSVAVSKHLRDPSIAIIAWTIGASVTASGVAILVAQPVVLLSVFAAAALGSLVSFLIFWRFGRFSKPEAFLACLPAGLTETMLFAERHGLNAPPIVVAHTVRIFLIVMVVPLLLAGERDGAAAATSYGVLPSLLQLGLLPVALGAFWLGRRIGMPAPAFMAPVIAIGAVSMTGVGGIAPPGGWLIIAQIIVGAALGVEVAKAALQSFRYYVLSLISATALLIVSLFTAYLAFGLLSTSYPFALLAMAPGGVSEMALVAFSIGEPAAMIVSLHLARVFATLGFLGIVDSATRPRAGRVIRA